MKRSVLILVIALILIGNSALCAAQFSQQASIRKSHTQERHKVQLSSSVSKSTRFVFRVKRYVYVSPAYENIARTQTITKSTKDVTKVAIAPWWLFRTETAPYSRSLLKVKRR